MVDLLGSFERIARPWSQKPLKRRAHRESHDNVTHPVCQNRHARWRKAYGEGPDRDANAGAMCR
jgi:hypothetical protein